MKNLIMGTALVVMLSVGVTAYAASYNVKKMWAKVETPSQTTEIYRVYDMENKVMCYYSYVKGATNATPGVDCVKL